MQGRQTLVEILGYEGVRGRMRAEVITVVVGRDALAVAVTSRPQVLWLEPSEEKGKAGFVEARSVTQRCSPQWGTGSIFTKRGGKWKVEF